MTYPFVLATFIANYQTLVSKHATNKVVIVLSFSLFFPQKKKKKNQYVSMAPSIFSSVHRHAVLLAELKTHVKWCLAQGFTRICEMFRKCFLPKWLQKHNFKGIQGQVRRVLMGNTNWKQTISCRTMRQPTKCVQLPKKYKFLCWLPRVFFLFFFYIELFVRLYIAA